MSERVLTELAGYQEILELSAELDVQRVILRGAAVDKFFELSQRLWVSFNEAGEPAPKKDIYELHRGDVEELYLARAGAHRVGYCAGFYLDYLPKIPQLSTVHVPTENPQ